MYACSSLVAYTLAELCSSVPYKNYYITLTIRFYVSFLLQYALIRCRSMFLISVLFYFSFVIPEKNLPHNMPVRYAGNINNSARCRAEIGSSTET